MKVFALAKETVAKFSQDNGNILAAALAYYTLFSIFPLILGLVAIAGFAVPQNGARDHFIQAIASQFPGSDAFIETTVRQVIQGRGAAGIIATIGLIWSASGVFGALTLSLDRITGSRQPRGFVGSTLLALGLVFGVGALFIFSLVVSALLGIAFSTRLPVVGLSLSEIPALYPLVAFVVPMVVTFFALGFLYHFVPSEHMPWNDVWPGAIIAATAFEVAKQLFAIYLGTIANFNAVYGSIGAVIGLLTWAYYASIVVLIGAEFNVVLSRRLPPSRSKRPPGRVA